MAKRLSLLWRTKVEGLNIRYASVEVVLDIIMLYSEFLILNLNYSLVSVARGDTLGVYYAN